MWLFGECVVPSVWYVMVTWIWSCRLTAACQTQFYLQLLQDQHEAFGTYYCASKAVHLTAFWKFVGERYLHG